MASFEQECAQSRGTGLGHERERPPGPVPVVLAYGPSARGIVTAVVLVPLALAVPFVDAMAVRLPAIDIPRGMSLVIKARPMPLNVLGSLIFVGPDISTLQGGQGYGLVPNEPISYDVESSDVIWISTNIAGSGVYLTCERM